MNSNTLKRAIAQAPAAIRPKTQSRDARRFDAYTVSRLLEEYRDPRAILLEIASMDTHELAEHIGATPADALAERRLCAQAVLPYVAQKLPVQVDMRHTKAIHLNIVDERQFTELLNLADTDALDPTDNVQLVQGLVIDNDTPAPTTASGLQPAPDALTHAEPLAAADAQHTLALDTSSSTPVGVEDRGLGLSENDERNNTA